MLDVRVTSTTHIGATQQDLRVLLMGLRRIMEDTEAGEELRQQAREFAMRIAEQRHKMLATMAEQAAKLVENIKEKQGEINGCLG